MVSKATVIGAGAMGTICAHILAENGANVALYARRPERVQELLVARENRRYVPGLRLSTRIVPTADARAALHGAELVISAVPCQHLRAVWRTLAAHIAPDTPLCSVTKGLELLSLARPSEILAELLPENPRAVLSGPSIAAELARCLPATVVVASAEDAIAQSVQAAMSTSWFRVYTSHDLIGVELAGAVKNVIALAAGILDGLHAGDNCKAALVTRGLVELTRLALALGARPETFTGLAGVGDLITTCVSPHGRNRQAGERIGRGEDLQAIIANSPHVIEGIPTTQAVLHMAERCGVEMPITEAVAAVIFQKKPPLAAITELMNRPLKSED